MESLEELLVESPGANPGGISKGTLKDEVPGDTSVGMAREIPDGIPRRVPRRNF